MTGLALVMLVYVVGLYADLAEQFTAWAERYEAIQLDEIPLGLFATALAAVWYSRRRTMELSGEIIRRAAAERELAINQAMYKNLFDEGLSGNFVATMGGRIVLSNQAFCAMSGRVPVDLNVATGGMWDGLVLRLQTQETVDYPEIVLHRSDGAPWVVAARFIKTSDIGLGLGEAVHGYCVDITEQYLADRELKVLLNENRALSRRVLQAQEEERRRIVREIHDDMGQFLTAIRLDAAVLPESQGPVLTIHAERIAKHVEHIQCAIRNLISTLRPMILDQHGLADAISHLVREWRRQHHETTMCYLVIDQSIGTGLPEDVSIVVYRLIQESLTNIARHANAARVDVRLCRYGEIGHEVIEIIIQDDGQGFDQTAVSSRGFGLVSMRERTEAIGGTFWFASGVGAGTRIHARLPLFSESIFQLSE